MRYYRLTFNFGGRRYCTVVTHKNKCRAVLLGITMFQGLRAITERIRSAVFSLRAEKN